MLWFTLSLMTALAVSTQDVWVKKWFSRLTPYDMLTYPLFYSLPLIIASLVFISVPVFDSTYIWTVAVSIPLNGVALILYMKAIKISPLSLTVPFLAFTPAFIIGTGYFFLDEMPSLWGVGGILVTCLGGYILNLEPGKWRFLAPFKAFFRETGSWVMFIVSFLFSFGAVIGKLGIIHSSPMFFTMTFFAGLNVTLILFFVSIKKVRIKTYLEEPWKGMVSGILLFIHAICHGFAINLTKAAYMISIKRLSIIFSMILGAIVFKEKNVIFRFGGAFLMFVGAAIISLKG